MAMPTSGSIGITTAPQGGCSSICESVFAECGFHIKNLVGLSSAVGFTAPHALSEFYGFPPSNGVKMVCIAGSGTDFVDDCVCKIMNLTTTSAMSAGQCYSLTICGNGYVPVNSGSYACLCVTCNGGTVCTCTWTTTNSAYSFVRTIKQGDYFNITLNGWNIDSDTYAWSYVTACACAISGIVGDFDAGSPTYCQIFTASSI